MLPVGAVNVNIGTGERPRDVQDDFLGEGLAMLSTLVKMLLFLAVLGILAAVASSSVLPLLVVAGVGYALVCVYQGLPR